MTTPTGKPALIYDALMSRALLMASTGPTLPVAVPEPTDEFVPPADGKYLRVTYLPNRPAWEGLTNGEISQGLLQVTVVWPRGQGLVGALVAVEAVKAHFPKTLSLINGGVRVKISKEPWHAQPLPEGGAVEVPVTIPWTA